MTAVTGANFRTGEAYWELSGPVPINRIATCRACRQTILKNSPVMADSSFQSASIYHTDTAPRLSSLEGPRACRDADGRELTRRVFQREAPSALGQGKWSVAARGYQPKYS